MPFLRALAAAFAIVLPATTLAAAAEPLAGDEIRSMVNGKRVYLATPFGGEFPLHYKTNGQVTGDGTALGLGKYFAPRETGRWFVDGNRLCQQFPTWYKGKVSCFTLQKTGEASLRWKRDDGYSGRARIGS